VKEEESQSTPHKEKKKTAATNTVITSNSTTHPSQTPGEDEASGEDDKEPLAKQFSAVRLNDRRRDYW
jgi:hypothetical protein